LAVLPESCVTSKSSSTTIEEAWLSISVLVVPFGLMLSLPITDEIEAHFNIFAIALIVELSNGTGFDLPDEELALVSLSHFTTGIINSRILLS